MAEIIEYNFTQNKIKDIEYDIYFYIVADTDEFRTKVDSEIENLIIESLKFDNYKIIFHNNPDKSYEAVMNEISKLSPKVQSKLIKLIIFEHIPEVLLANALFSDYVIGLLADDGIHETKISIETNLIQRL